jgi:hypothetical protein
MLLSLSLIAQTYPKKKVINGDTVVVMTQKQASEINVVFRELRLDNKQYKSKADSLRAVALRLNEDVKDYRTSLDNASNQYLLSEEENQMLRDAQQSIRIGRVAQDISVITLMFTIVMLIKISTIK